MSATAPTRSSPWIRKPFFGPLSFHLAALATDRNAALFSGTKSSWALRPAGKPEKTSRFTPALRS